MALFLAKGLPKILGSPDQIAEFERLGYPDWFRVVVGLAEIAAALLLLQIRSTGIALTTMATIMVGAAVTLINVGDNRESLVPIAILVLLGFFSWHNRTR